VIRIATHPKVFARPSALAETIELCNFLLEQPHCVVIQPGEQHWSIFCRLCKEADARGNLAPDAWFAALAIESGCEWITLDRDYARGFVIWRFIIIPISLFPTNAEAVQKARVDQGQAALSLFRICLRPLLREPARLQIGIPPACRH
jgi:hypothetical protein